MINISELTKSSFDPFLDDKFEVWPEGMDKFELELVKISDRSGEDIESFSLIFRGEKNRMFNHNTHKITHPKMGEFFLFIGPVMYPKRDGIYYEVVFNRLKTI
jgi:hypothetical protein